MSAGRNSRRFFTRSRQRPACPMIHRRPADAGHCRLKCKIFTEHLRVSDDGSQRRVQFVCNTGRELADADHLLLLHHCILRLLQLARPLFNFFFQCLIRLFELRRHSVELLARELRFRRRTQFSERWSSSPFDDFRPFTQLVDTRSNALREKRRNPDGHKHRDQRGKKDVNIGAALRGFFDFRLGFVDRVDEESGHPIQIAPMTWFFVVLSGSYGPFACRYGSATARRGSTHGRVRDREMSRRGLAFIFARPILASWRSGHRRGKSKRSPPADFVRRRRSKGLCSEGGRREERPRFSAEGADRQVISIRRPRSSNVSAGAGRYPCFQLNT